MPKKSIALFTFFILIFTTTLLVSGQESQFTRQDSLRGTINSYRDWWDLNYYHLNIQVDIPEKSINGSNEIVYTVIEPRDTMQIDLQPPLMIEKVVQNEKELTVLHEGNAHFILIQDQGKKGSKQSLTVHYSGKPKEAVRPPWYGGITWNKDSQGKPFVASSCQGLGASVWWPNKDHMYDEPDSMLISIRVPSELMDISNGRLREVQKHDDNTTTYHWFVSQPINNYGVNINIGNYTSWKETYKGEKGPLDVSYYVLKENKQVARSQFKQVPMMLEAFEHWFGPYPFYEDGYKLVEAPYLGMEHQSSVTYGNGFENGYLGSDWSGTGWGLKFDFIIIHESGHEWFANNITYIDIADMWIHESFTNYSECLYVEYQFGKEAGADYVIGTRKVIQNDRPIIGKYGVNHSGSSDMYFKGGNMLHTIRQLVNDDEKWRLMLREMNKHFYHKVVTTEQIENFMINYTRINLAPVFDQYLRDIKIPVLEYHVNDMEISYRWNNVVSDFDMPVKIWLNDTPQWIQPTVEWQKQTVTIKNPNISMDRNFYASIMRTY